MGLRNNVSSLMMVFAISVAILWESLASAEDVRTAYQGVTVEEVTIAAPDIVAIELRDPPFQPGGIVALESPSDRNNGYWVQSGAKWGMVIGHKRDHLRISDSPPRAYLDRNLIDDASRYPSIGGYRVINVFRKSVPYDSGIYMVDGATRTGASFKHYIYLQLDRNLIEGVYSISFPGNLLPTISFRYDLHKTRAIALRSTQVGHRAGDVGKSAYLALWLPGGANHGSIDFRSYGIDKFVIIDAQDNEVFSSSLRLRLGPEDTEPGNGVQEPLSEYTNVGTPPVPIIAITPSVPPRVTAPNHSFEDGERIALERLFGDQDAGAIFATVTGVTPDTFFLKDAGDAPFGEYAGGGFAKSLHSSTRAGTYVFELDYSSWMPKQPGTYRLAISGLGVSDPFEIRSDIWFDLGRLSLEGLYNHRSGIPLDGRFGYTRPAAFRPGDGMTIFETRLPLSWSSEGGGFVNFPTAAEPDWLTDSHAPATYWGGYMDAGDWDRRVQHVEVASLLLDVFEWMPSFMRARSLGVPQSAEVLDDPIYKTSGTLPDLINEAIWSLDFFRRLQMPDGSVRGGIESAGHPMLGEPSYLEHQTVFAYAPDHVSSLKYAAVAAQLARILRDIGERDLATLFEKSALSAFEAGDRGYADPDGYYADAIAIGQRTGLFKEQPWEVLREKLQKTAYEYKVAAAAALWRLNEDPANEAIFREAWQNKIEIHAHTADAAWDYLNAHGGDATIKAEIKGRFIGEASWIADAQSNLAYPSMKHPGAPSGWGQGTAPDYNMVKLFMRGHKLSGDPKILKIMELTSHVILGANQTGMSFTTGVGIRQIRHPLQEDHRAMGVGVPRGITIYGFGPQSGTAQGWVFGPFWSPLAEVGTGENTVNRTVYPARYSLPYFEYLIEHPAVIMQQEYTVQQPIATTAALWFYIASLEQPKN